MLLKWYKHQNVIKLTLNENQQAYDSLQVHSIKNFSLKNQQIDLDLSTFKSTEMLQASHTTDSRGIDLPQGTHINIWNIISYQEENVQCPTHFQIC